MIMSIVLVPGTWVDCHHSAWVKVKHFGISENLAGGLGAMHW